MSQGSLISFMLYQSSLSSSFDSLGYCFTGMSAAVGESLREVCILLRSCVLRCLAIRIPAQRRSTELSALTAGAADQVVTLMLRKPEVSFEDLSVCLSYPSERFSGCHSQPSRLPKSALDRRACLP